MTRRIQSYSLLLLFGFVLGCASISPELRENADSSLPLKEVQENPDAYKGKIVLWGGHIIQALPQKDGTTLIEVLKWPLGWWDEPRETVAFHGRFLILLKGQVDPSVYKKGKRITVAGEIKGEIQGNKINELSDPTYRYPVILSQELHVWEHNPYRYSSVPDDRATWNYREYEGILHY
jgi:outer membrane lipoprotein